MNSVTKFLFASILSVFFIWLVFGCLLPFLLPFLLGLGLALTAEPLIKLLTVRCRLSRRISSPVCVSCTFLLISALLFLLLAVLFRALSALGRILPDLSASAASGLALLRQWLLSLTLRAPSDLQPLLKKQILAFFSDGTAFLTQGARYIFSLAGGVLTHIPDRAFTLLTGLISGFMLSSRLPRLRAFLKARLSPEWILRIRSLLRRLRTTAGCWLLAQLKLMGVTLLLLTVGLILLKIPYAPVWALGISLLDALPVLGTGTVLIPWSLISLLQKDLPRALGLLCLYGTAFLTRSTLEPRLVGRQLGLDPLMTLAALYFGYRLWGFGGMLLSPLLAVTVLNMLPREPGKNL